MKKRDLLFLFLALSTVGLSSCGGENATSSIVETTTKETTKEDKYILDSETREYMAPYLKCPARLSFKKHEIEGQNSSNGNCVKWLEKYDYDDAYWYYMDEYGYMNDYSKYGKSEQYIYRHSDNNIYHVEYSKGMLISWEDCGTVMLQKSSTEGRIEAGYKAIESIFMAEKDGYIQIDTIDLTKKEKGNFEGSADGYYCYLDNTFAWSVSFSYEDGILCNFSYSDTNFNDKEYSESFKLYLDKDFEKTYPDFDPLKAEEIKYEEYIESLEHDSYASHNPLSDEDKLIDMDNNRTYYQLLVYSFADGNGDGIGDFKGIIDHLDYLVGLGIEGIWLSPILEANSYHSYDIDNYYHIRSAYEVYVDGINYDLSYLLKECHKRNIKVLMDLVINHTSYYNTFYEMFNSWYSLTDNRFGFPEFDFDKPMVRKAVEDIGTYWLNYGVDGFRLDAAMWIYNSGKGRHNKNYEFWNDWCSKMKEVKPDCYIIGEVLDDNHDLAYNYAQAGFDSTFDFNALGTVISAVKDSTYDYASNTMANVNKALANNPNYILGRALSNHDIGRFNQSHPDSNDIAYYVETVEEIKLANALNALTPGNTFIYYGDELGLLGTATDTRPNYYYDMNYRTPMPFENERTDSVAYFEGFHGQGVTTSNTITNESISEILSDPNSIYNKLKEALALKNSSDVLQKGTLSTLEDLEENLSGFDVTYNGKTIRVLYVSSNVEGIVDIEINGELLYNLSASAYVNGTTTLVALSNCDLIAYEL